MRRKSTKPENYWNFIGFLIFMVQKLKRCFRAQNSIIYRSKRLEPRMWYFRNLSPFFFRSLPYFSTRNRANEIKLDRNFFSIFKDSAAFLKMILLQWSMEITIFWSGFVSGFGSLSMNAALALFICQFSLKRQPHHLPCAAEIKKYGSHTDLICQYLYSKHPGKLSFRKLDWAVNGASRW